MPSETLLLVPTALERKLLELAGPWPENVRTELCGFGPVAAAARSAALIAAHGPARVLLVGIAGSYSLDVLPAETACTFSSVRMDGVGAGEVDDQLGPADLGLPQWPGPRPAQVVDALDLPWPSNIGDRGGAQLLTVCSCAASEDQAARRRERFPSAMAEDMEGFAVALSAHLAGVPAGIVRGVSNLAGDRNVGGWTIAGALEAAYRSALDWLAAPPSLLR